MVRALILLFALGFITPSAVFADSRVFLGTNTGLSRTAETFTCGKYNDTRLFLVIGTEPTGKAIKDVYGWSSGSTFTGDLKSGMTFFNNQFSESVSSVPQNAVDFGRSVGDFVADPVEEIQDFSLLTPALIVGKTIVNIFKIGWYAVKLPCEPVFRTGAGTIALAGSPFIKPVQFVCKYGFITGIAVYGYSSSAVGGAVLLGATGAVFAMDLATSPFVAAYESFSAY